MFPRQAGNYLLGTCLLWVFPFHNIHAQESARTVISPLATLGKLAAALLVVLCVFWVFARVMRQLQGHQAGGLQHGLKVISTLSVGQRERVIVVEVGDEQLVLGVTATQINTLHVLNTPLTEGRAVGDQTDFRQKLTAALNNRIDTK